MVRTEKKCPHCNEIKDITEFRPDKKRLKDGNGVSSYCKTCTKKKDREKYYSNLGRRTRHENNRLKRMYGLSLEELEAKIVNQDNKCAICGEELVRSKNKTCLDHDHVTGKARGVICFKCNITIGFIEKTPELVKPILTYLDNE
jgi:hypothetical protein